MSFFDPSQKYVMQYPMGLKIEPLTLEIMKKKNACADGDQYTIKIPFQEGIECILHSTSNNKLEGTWRFIDLDSSHKIVFNINEQGKRLVGVPEGFCDRPEWIIEKVNPDKNGHGDSCIIG